MLSFLPAEYKKILQEIRPLKEVEARAAVSERRKYVAWLNNEKALETGSSSTGDSDQLKLMISEE